METKGGTHWGMKSATAMDSGKYSIPTNNCRNMHKL